MTRVRADTPWQVILIAAATLGSVTTILAVPSMGAQLAIVAAVVATITSLMIARSGRSLNAAWIIVLAIYLLDAGSVALPALGSPVPMVLVVALLPLPFVGAALWLRPGSLRRLWPLAPLVGFLGLAGLSLLWSPAAAYGASKLAQWVVTGLVPCSAILILVAPDRPVAWRVLVIAAAAYTAVLLATGNMTLYPGRLIVFDGNPIWVARALFIGALVIAFGPVPPFVKLLLVPPMLFAGYLTDSLGPAVGLVLGAGMGLAERIRLAGLSSRRTRLALAALGIGVAFGVTVVLAVVTSAAPASLTPIVGDPDVTSRARYLEVAGQMFAAAPVLGSGLGGFAAMGLADPYPHNLFAEVASELGLVGLALVLGWVALALRGAAQSPLLVALVVATSCFALFSGNVAGNTEFWMCTAVAVAMRPVRNRSARDVVEAAA